MHQGLMRLVMLMVSLMASATEAQTDARGLPSDPAREAALLAAGGPGFAIRRTSHFIIAYDTDRRMVDELSLRLEQTFERVQAFCGRMGIPARRPDHRLEVLLFDARESYDRYAAGQKFASAGTSGVYLESINRSAFFNAAKDPELIKLGEDIAAARGNAEGLARTLAGIKNGQARVEVEFADGRRVTGTRDEVAPQLGKEIESGRRQLVDLERRRLAYMERINRTVIQHEAAHQVLFEAGVHVRGASNPRWLVEGLACLFETPGGPADKGPGSGVNQLRLRDFRSAIGAGSASQQLWRQFERAVAGERLPALSALVSDARLFDARGEQGANCYACAWALADYLSRRQAERLAAYLKTVSRRQPGVKSAPAEELALFEEHFGRINQSFIESFAGYVLGLPCSEPAEGF